MQARQLRSVVTHAGGNEQRTEWYAENDPAAMEALKALLDQCRGSGYVVWWEYRDAPAGNGQRA